MKSLPAKDSVRRSGLAFRITKRFFVLTVLAFVLLGGAVSAQAQGTLTVAWDANPEPDIAGYILEYGTTSNNYPFSVDVGNQTQYTLTGLTPGATYYLVVRAYNSAGAQSPRSAEVSGVATTPIYRLTISHTGQGAGSVTSTPAGINCGADCTEDYLWSTVVTLNATPASGSTFAGWFGHGDCNDGSVTMTADKSCNARFNLEPNNYTLTVTRAGNGTGTVTSSPAGINCGGDCSESYTDGTLVTLTANPAADSVFDGWSGSADCSDGTVTMQAAKSCTATFSLAPVSNHVLTVSRTGDGSGTVTSSPAGINCGGDCSESYAEGTVVTLTATPATGSTFDGWSGHSDCSNSSVTMQSARSCTATFSAVPPANHLLTVSKAGDGGGTVTSSPAGINCGGDCSESYAEGTVVTLTATPATGSTFDGWNSGDCADGTVTMSSARSCTATFSSTPPVNHLLTVNRTGDGSGTVTSSPAGVNCGNDCTQTYAEGTVVTLTATPAAGSTFDGWSGHGDCSDGTVTMQAARTCTATFTLVPPANHVLTVSHTGQGSGTVTSSPTGISCGADCSESYVDGTVVTLSATPAAGSTFAGWFGHGDCTDGSVTMNADKSCNARFNPVASSNHLLTVSKAGDGGGTVTSSPAGINCGGDCSESYAEGTVVTLTATPAAGSTFDGWNSGDCADGTVTMSSARSCTATFSSIPPVNHLLTVNRTGDGSGTVTSSPAGVNCGNDCTQTYAEGTVVTLTATPAAGSTFDGWNNGDCSDGTVTMQAARTCTATFTLVPPANHVLTVSHTGQGSGTVTSSPAGISCGADCSESYVDGTVVNLSAAPAAGSTFAGWFGHGDCTDGSVTMNADKSCNARFNPVASSNHLLTVSKAGDGGGTVTSSPAGINCGGDCSESYAEGTVVTLTATPATGSTFDGWNSGDCADGTVTMSSARSCTATFTLVPAANHVLTLSTTGQGSGTVTSNPQGIDCGADCSESYTEGTVVTLTATPAADSSFNGWGGHIDCSDGAVTIQGDRACTADFALSAPVDPPEDPPSNDPPSNSPTTEGAVTNDFDGDGQADLASFTPATGEWRIVSSSGQSTGQAVGGLALAGGNTTVVNLSHLGGGLVPVPGDYDGDRVVDVAVWQPVSGEWHIFTAVSGFSSGDVYRWGKAGDVPVPGDYDGDGTTDRAVYRPANSTWRIAGTTKIKHGRPGDIPVPADYDGDGTTDIAVFRPWKGTWLIQGERAIRWGEPGDTPVPADYDGDGTTDLGVFRRATATWMVKGQFTRVGGQVGDIPVPLDMDGDGRADLVTYSPADAAWRTHNRSGLVAGAAEASGRVGEMPAVARSRILSTDSDFDADGRADLSLYRRSQRRWLGRLSASDFRERFSITFGSDEAKPAPGDYDGDGFTDLSVYRPDNGTWLVKTSSSDFKRLQRRRQMPRDGVPMHADYDGDGRTDMAVYSPDTGRWTVYPSSSRRKLELDWGYPGDQPFAGDWDGDGRADVATYTASVNVWAVLLSTTDYEATLAVQMSPGPDLGDKPETIADILRGAGVGMQGRDISGPQGDAVPVAVDVDGDGRVDAGRYLRESGLWEFLLSSGDYQNRFEFNGVANGVPVPADYLGRGWSTLGTYHPSTGTWRIDGLPPVTVGNANDDPLPGAGAP